VKTLKTLRILIVALGNPKGRWMSSIHLDGKYRHLGMFDTKEEAQECYRQKVASL
jgi:hypothetical protein